MNPRAAAASVRPRARLRVACVLAGLLFALAGTDRAAAAADLSGRIKAFGSRTFLPDDDLLRARRGTPRDEGSLDLRLALRDGSDDGTFDGELAWDVGLRHDSGGFDALPGVGSGGVRDRRLLDLSHSLVSDRTTRVEQRLDRLWGAVRLGEWRVALGRQAASFGNGIVFQPMDLASPFAPTEIDRDYKRGEDMLQVSRPFADGSEVGAVLVGRRGEGSGLDGSAGTSVLHLRTFVGTLATELLAGRHLGDPLAAAGVSGPLGTAVWRLDLVGQRVDGDWRLSGVVNIDWSLVVGARNVYLFAELYRNGFGLDSPTLAGLASRPALQARLARGEVFTLGRHALAIGGTVEWHPLVNQQLLLIEDPGDGSVLVQTTLAWEPDDHQRWQLSAVAPLGGRDEAFGRLVVGRTPEGDPRTLGGGPRMLLRWSRYF